MTYIMIIFEMYCFYSKREQTRSNITHRIDLIITLLLLTSREEAAATAATAAAAAATAAAAAAWSTQNLVREWMIGCLQRIFI